MQTKTKEPAKWAADQLSVTRFAGSECVKHFAPGAHAPGFMLSSASRTLTQISNEKFEMIYGRSRPSIQPKDPLSFPLPPDTALHQDASSESFPAYQSGTSLAMLKRRTRSKLRNRYQ